MDLGFVGGGVVVVEISSDLTILPVIPEV